MTGELTLWGRSQGIDTNFYFAAAGLHDPATATPFALYYGLGVAAVCVHLGVAACRTRAERRWPVIMLTALVCATVLVLLLAGRIHPFSMPGPHRDSTANAAP